MVFEISGVFYLLHLVCPKHLKLLLLLLLLLVVEVLGLLEGKLVLGSCKGRWIGHLLASHWLLLLLLLLGLSMI